MFLCVTRITDSVLELQTLRIFPCSVVESSTVWVIVAWEELYLFTGMVVFLTSRTIRYLSHRENCSCEYTAQLLTYKVEGLESLMAFYSVGTIDKTLDWGLLVEEGPKL